MVFLLQIRDTEVLGPRSGIKKWIFNTILLILSPLVQPGTLLGFFYCWKTGDIRQEVGSTGKNVPYLDDFISGTFPLCLEAGEDDQWVDGVLTLPSLAYLLLPYWSPSLSLV